MLDRQDWERLVEIREEMCELFEEARTLVRHAGGFEYERARAYWMGGMDNYLGEGKFASQLSGCSMEDTIRALEPCEEMDDEEVDGDE